MTVPPQVRELARELRSSPCAGRADLHADAAGLLELFAAAIDVLFWHAPHCSAPYCEALATWTRGATSARESENACDRHRARLDLTPEEQAAGFVPPMEIMAAAKIRELAVVFPDDEENCPED